MVLGQESSQESVSEPVAHEREPRVEGVRPPDLLPLIPAPPVITDWHFDYLKTATQDLGRDFGTEFKTFAAQVQGRQDRSRENLVAGRLVGDGSEEED